MYKITKKNENGEELDVTSYNAKEDKETILLFEDWQSAIRYIQRHNLKDWMVKKIR